MSEELVKSLIQLGLDDGGIQCVRDTIEVLTQESEKLDKIVNLCPDTTKLIGQIPNHTAIHIHGHPTSGKTAFALHLINCLDKKYKVLWLDTSFTMPTHLLKNPTSVYIFPTTKIKYVIGAVKGYAVVVLDDFASTTDPENIAKLIGECKRNNTLLITANQVRVSFKSRSPQPFKAHLEVLYDISLKMQRAENFAHYSSYQIVVDRDRIDPTKVRAYSIIKIKHNGTIQN